MSSSVSGILMSAVSGRKRQGTAPRKAMTAVIRNGALSDHTDWESVCQYTLFHINVVLTEYTMYGDPICEIIDMTLMTAEP